MFSSTNQAAGWKAFYFKRRLLDENRNFTKLEHEQFNDYEQKVKKYLREIRSRKPPPPSRLKLFLKEMTERKDIFIREFFMQDDEPRTYLANRYFSAGLTYTGEHRHMVWNKSSGVPIYLHICQPESASQYQDKCDMNILPNREECVVRDFCETPVTDSFVIPQRTVYFFHTVTHSLITVERLDPPYEDHMDIRAYDSDHGSSGFPTPVTVARTDRPDGLDVNNQLDRPPSTGSILDPSSVVETVMMDIDDDNNDAFAVGSNECDGNDGPEVEARRTEYTLQRGRNTNSNSFKGCLRETFASKLDSSETCQTMAGQCGENDDDLRPRNVTDVQCPTQEKSSQGMQPNIVQQHAGQSTQQLFLQVTHQVSAQLVQQQLSEVTQQISAQSMQQQQPFKTMQQQHARVAQQISANSMQQQPFRNSQQQHAQVSLQLSDQLIQKQRTQDIPQQHSQAMQQLSQAIKQMCKQSMRIQPSQSIEQQSCQGMQTVSQSKTQCVQNPPRSSLQPPSTQQQGGCSSTSKRGTIDKSREDDDWDQPNQYSQYLEDDIEIVWENGHDVPAPGRNSSEQGTNHSSRTISCRTAAVAGSSQDPQEDRDINVLPRGGSEDTSGPPVDGQYANVQQLQNEYEDLQNQYENLQNRYEDLQNRCEELENRFEDLRRNYENVSRENSELRDRISLAANVLRNEMRP